jgi:dihydroorotate dehydrogenase electron transfer subunit
MKKINDFEIIDSKKLAADYCLLTVAAKKKLPAIQPGQFAELEVPHNKNVFLRRPFSISDASTKKLNFLIKVIGKGTAELASLKIGEKISIVYPLGNGFKPVLKSTALLVGGGCGIAPLFFLAKTLAKLKTDVTVIYGGKKRTDILLTKEFKKYATLLVTTEDGSLGLKGFVTDQMKKLDLPQFKQIYTCGPEIMMKNVYHLGKEKNIPVQASLESIMGCGIGACLCCVTETKNEGPLCVCQDGPVFEGDRLKW